MNIPRRALILLLWPAFCGLVVGGGLGLITGSLSAGLLFAGIAVVVSLLILNGWEMENIGEVAESQAPLFDPQNPIYANLPGNAWHVLLHESNAYKEDALSSEVGLNGDLYAHGSDFDNDRWH